MTTPREDYINLTNILAQSSVVTEKSQQYVET